MTSSKTPSPTLTSRRRVTHAEGGSEIEHELFCVPRPDESDIRMESFRHERSDATGRVTSRPLVTRCMECGAQAVEDDQNEDDRA